MKHKCLAERPCPLARAYGVVGDWWSLLIVTQVVMGVNRRFSEIQQSLGMAKNILTARLAKLVESEILKKQPASDGSAYEEYVPTKKGRDLFVVIVALRQWGEKYFHDENCGGEKLIDRAERKVVPPVRVLSKSGKNLGPEDLELTVANKRAV